MLGLCSVSFRKHQPEDILRAMQAAGMKHYVATHRDLVTRDLLEKAGLLA